MENLIYFIIASVIMIIFFLVDGISHQRFNKKINFLFHVIGIGVVLILSGILIVREFVFSFLVLPGTIVFLAGLLIIKLSFDEIKNNFLRAKGVRRLGIYKRVRHPMYAGIILSLIGVILIVPTLFVFIYCLIASSMIVWQASVEERYMIKRFGEKYLKYKRESGMFIPRR